MFVIVIPILWKKCVDTFVLNAHFISSYRWLKTKSLPDQNWCLLVVLVCSLKREEEAWHLPFSNYKLNYQFCSISYLVFCHPCMEKEILPKNVERFWFRTKRTLTFECQTISNIDWRIPYVLHIIHINTKPFHITENCQFYWEAC